jgi:hypothetical protein
LDQLVDTTKIDLTIDKSNVFKTIIDDPKYFNFMMNSKKKYDVVVKMSFRTHYEIANEASINSLIKFISFDFREINLRFTDGQILGFIAQVIKVSEIFGVVLFK